MNQNLTLNIIITFNGILRLLTNEIINENKEKCKKRKEKINQKIKKSSNEGLSSLTILYMQ